MSLYGSILSEDVLATPLFLSSMFFLTMGYLFCDYVVSLQYENLVCLCWGFLAEFELVTAGTTGVEALTTSPSRNDKCWKTSSQILERLNNKQQTPRRQLSEQNVANKRRNNKRLNNKSRIGKCQNTKTSEKNVANKRRNDKQRNNKHQNNQINQITK